MPLVSEVYASKYLSHQELKGREYTVTIRGSRQEMFRNKAGDDEPLIILDVGGRKEVVLNKTNGRRLGEYYGDNSDDWNGKQIILSTHETQMGPGLHVLPAMAPPQPPVPPPAPDTAFDPNAAPPQTGYVAPEDPLPGPAATVPAEVQPFDPDTSPSTSPADPGPPGVPEPDPVAPTAAQDDDIPF